MSAFLLLLVACSSATGGLDTTSWKLESYSDANGNIEKLKLDQHSDKPSLNLLLLHDDTKREFAYTAGANKILRTAQTQQWTIVSIKADFKKVFPV